ncbi:kinase-like domain-containing protein [Spinellus fusiger]|nr:kinase-like domain-containing protein [Spinellus fusiger]
MSFKESTNLPKPRRPSFSRKQLEGVFPINKAKEMSFKESTNPPKPRIYSFHTQQLEELLPANGKDNYTKDALNCPEDADTNLDNSYTLFTMMKCPPQEHQHYSTTTGLGYDSPDLDTSHTMDLLFANDYQFTTTPSDKFMLEHMSTHALQYDSSDSELCYSPTAALDTVYESENAHPSVQSLPQNSLPSMPSHLSSLFQLGSTKVLHSMEKEKRENEPTATSPPEPSISTSPEMASYLETEHTLSNENPIDNSSHQNSTVRSQMSSASSTSTASRLSRLSQLSFAKKLPSRNNIPFHMRYQEWTDQKMKKEQEEPLSLSHSLPNSLPEQASLYQFPVARRERIELPLPTDLPLVKEHPILKTKLASKKAIFSVKPNGSLSSPLLKSGRPASKTQTLPPISRGGDKTPPTQLRSSRVSPLTKDGSGKLTHNSANGVSGGVSGAKKQPPQSPDILPLPPLHHSPPKEEISLPRRKSTGNLALHGTLEGVEDCLQLQDATGYTVARYKLGNSIGKGHFGTVHRALDLRTGQMVAVKRIKLNVTRKEDVNDVLQEAQLLQSLTHPNIVMYKGFIQTHHHIHIVLEYVENGSLLSTLKAFKSFPEALVAGYCQRILEGLTYLHAQDVVHCDLKAANILTTKAGDVKLSDFGVSLNLKLKETQAGVVAGTPNWMAPEVIELKGATTKSDIWSLGCTIIELCTGKPPYADVNPMTALFRIVEDDRPPLPDSISKELEHFLGLCFQKSPQDRPTADELSNHPWIFNNCHNDKTKKMAIPASMVKQVVEQAAIDIPTHAASDTMERPSMVPSSFPTLSREGSFPFVEPSLSQSTPTLLSQLPPMVPSILVKKYEKRLADQQNEKNIERKHHFVKGSFAKGKGCSSCRHRTCRRLILLMFWCIAAIRCKSCQLPIKQKALVCEGEMQAPSVH